METAGKKLRRYRKAAGLSGEKLGELAGCNKSKISKLENDEQRLDVQWAKRLAPHLKVHPFQLLPDVEYDQENQDLIDNINRLEEKEKELVESFVATILQKKEEE